MKQQEKLPEMVCLYQSLLYQQVCAELTPEYAEPNTEDGGYDELPREDAKDLYTPTFVQRFDAMLAAHGLKGSGTTGGWSLNQKCVACPCSDYEGRWHYICVC